MVRFLWSPRIYFLFSSPVLILLPETWISCLLCIRDCSGNRIPLTVSCVADSMFKKTNLWTENDTLPQELNKKKPEETKELQRKIHHPYWGSQTKLDQLGDLCSVPQRLNSYPLNIEEYKTSFWPRTKERKDRNIIWEKVFWDPQIICYLYITMPTTHNNGPCDEHL